MDKISDCTDLRKSVIGIETKVPVRSGKSLQFVNFDNAASTPTFKQVRDKINDFLPWYSNVHRGMGFKSQISSYFFDEIRERLYEFVGADKEKDVLIFGKNTTEMVNILAHRLELTKDDIVLTTLMEHHSNDLPWRATAQVIHMNVDKDGRLDFNEYINYLKKYEGKIKVVVLSGASNVTGIINDVYKYAEEAHKHGSIISVDAAQLAPHRPVDMLPHGDPRHLDFVTYSAHKIYAPFGIGVLAGDRKLLKRDEPFLKGGGTVKIVTEDTVVWDDAPAMDEAGTPVVLGVVALMESINVLHSCGWEKIINHEAEMTSYLLNKMLEIPEIEIYGDKDPENARNRLGVVPFNIKGKHHAFVSAVLSYEGAIGVRNGCFCAHPYLLHLMNVNNEKAKEVRKSIVDGDRSVIPGIIRVSFGCYNNLEEIDRLIDQLKEIVTGKYDDDYLLLKKAGEYKPKDFQFKFDSFFNI